MGVAVGTVASARSFERSALTFKVNEACGVPKFRSVVRNVPICRRDELTHPTGSRAGDGSPNGRELTTLAAHYRDPSTAPTHVDRRRRPGSGAVLLVYVADLKARVGSEHMPLARQQNQRGDPIDRVASAVVLQSRAFTSPESAASK